MIKRVAIVLIGILVILAGRWLFYHSGFYSAPSSKMPSYEQIVVPSVPSIGFSDNYTQGKGTILIDFAHSNNSNLGELDVLILRLISRGLTIELLSTGTDLEAELSKANAFIVVCPQTEFSKKEKEAVGKFVTNGGKLLLIADPTRPSEINSLSLKFSLIFEPDYLYNMKENDANYRNIFVTEFKENEITKNLKKIALYTTGSISSDNHGIALVDEDTFSSLIETRKKLSPIALDGESKVLAIYDLTFITEPYNGVLDNNQLISNMADWLKTSAKETAK